MSASFAEAAKAAAVQAEHQRDAAALRASIERRARCYVAIRDTAIALGLTYPEHPEDLTLAGGDLGALGSEHSHYSWTVPLDYDSVAVRLQGLAHNGKVRATIHYPGLCGGGFLDHDRTRRYQEFSTMEEAGRILRRIEEAGTR